MTVFAVLLVPLVLWLLADSPAAALRRTARGPTTWNSPCRRRREARARWRCTPCARAVPRAGFWIWICGWSTNGLIGTHFIRRGDYFAAWLTAGVLCVGAAVACLFIRRLPGPASQPGISPVEDIGEPVTDSM